MTPIALPSPRSPELDRLLAIAESAAEIDGQPPFSDQALIDARTGARAIILLDGVAAAIVAPGEAEFVVDPDARGAGHGTALLERLIADTEAELLIWAHGDHPAARALAASHGFTPVRELLQLRAPVPAPAPAIVPVPDDSARRNGHLRPERALSTRSFRPGLDDAEWLRVNARAFAAHPEQGRMSQSDLDELMREPWFDAEDFLLLRDADTQDGGEIAGYCWLKVEHGVGEFYVVGVDPSRQGEGLGRMLMVAGFARLAARGIRTAALYVEGDNAPALALYRSFGFETHSVDLQYALRR
jgi:mycothiol synthase